MPSDPASPRLSFCPEGLPRQCYVDPGHFGREMAAIHGREWICAGRLADISPGTMRRVSVGTAPALLLRGPGGALSAFHNTCRHRGAELCASETARARSLITCSYHAWAYAADDGRLVSTGLARPGPGFRREDHGLVPLTVRVWNGFVFLNGASDPSPLAGDVPLATLENWPMADLVTGHRWQSEIACNWKLFWENYSECLHCPGIHPELSDMVPVYRRGLMAANEAEDWSPADDRSPALRPGAESWTADGAPCGPPFPGLTPAERAAGYTFVTIWPSLYVVAHCDHVRSVRIEPLAVDRTRLVAEWHFPPATLARAGFDPASVAAFATLVMQQDGAAAEINQRGLASPAFDRARLMPEEYEIHRFHRWIADRIEVPL